MHERDGTTLGINCRLDESTGGMVALSMTNKTRRELRRINALTELGYSTREAEEAAEFEKTAPPGSHFANALAFIVESLSDPETPVYNTSDLENLDSGTLLEFAEMYNFTDDAYRKALQQFSAAVSAEVSNAFWNGECRNCMQNPPTYN